MVALLRQPDSPPALDVVTIDAARQGERWAQRRVIRRHAPTVWAVVVRIVGRNHGTALAEDATQDALVAVLQSLSRLRDPDPRTLASFVATIAARTAIGVLRKQRPELPLDDTVPLTDEDRGSRPDRAVEKRRLASSIERAIGELSPEIRATFVLRAYHELEYRAIAEALEVDVGTVKSRLWRARAALKASLGEVFDDE